MKFPTTFTCCRDGKPLLKLGSQLFNGMEFRPAGLRRLGQMLIWLADLGEIMPTGGRNWKPSHVEVDMDSIQSSTGPNDPSEAGYWAVQFIKNFERTSNPTARLGAA